MFDHIFVPGTNGAWNNNFSLKWIIVINKILQVTDNNKLIQIIFLYEFTYIQLEFIYTVEVCASLVY